MNMLLTLMSGAFATMASLCFVGGIAILSGGERG